MNSPSLVKIIACGALLVLTVGCAQPLGYGTQSDKIAESAAKNAYAEKPTSSAEKSSGAHLDLILQMQEQGLWFASLAHLDAFQNSYGSTPEALILRAHALRQTGDLAQSQAIYQTLLSGAQASQAFHGLGLLSGDAGQFLQASIFFENARKIDPLSPIVLSDLSYALIRTGNNQRAYSYIMQAAQLAPEDKRVLSNLALYFYMQGDLMKSRAIIEKISTNDAKAWDGMIEQGQIIKTQIDGRLGKK